MRRSVIAVALAITAVTAGAATALSTQKCPPGDSGVVVEHDNHFVNVCTNIV
jgi:hypothetical protein